MNNKFQDGETVFVKEKGINETVNTWSYIPSMHRYSYTTFESPATFYFESDLDFASSDAIKTTEQPSKAAADKGILTEEELNKMESKIIKRVPQNIDNDKLHDLINSHRQLLSANAELSFEKNAYKKALSKIVCLNISMPDEVFNLANNALEELK